jgi:hypothetical protein
MTAAVNLSADDRLDIMDLYARYAFLDVFLPNATLYMAQSATGHKALRKWHETFLKDSGFPGIQAADAGRGMMRPIQIGLTPGGGNT